MLNSAESLFLSAFSDHVHEHPSELLIQTFKKIECLDFSIFRNYSLPNRTLCRILNVYILYLLFWYGTNYGLVDYKYKCKGLYLFQSEKNGLWGRGMKIWIKPKGGGIILKVWEWLLYNYWYAK
jgi:hypothetical protein